MVGKIYFSVPCDDGILKISQDAVVSLVRNVFRENEDVSEASIPETYDAEVWSANKGILIAGGDSDDSCRIRVYATVALGSAITEKAAQIQEQIKTAVEDCASLKVVSVDVFVAGVSFPRQ